MPVAVAGPPASPALRAHQAAAPTAPPPTPLMPSSIAGVALNLGIIFVAICYDYQALKTPDELSVALWQAHYFRKAVQPVLLMQGLQGLLFAGGLVNYSTKLIDVVRFKMSMAKRIIDLTGVVLFVLSALMAVMLVAPAERAAGQTFKDGPAVVPREQVAQLSEYHWGQLFLGIALGIQQVLSWKREEAPPAAQRPKRD